MDRILFLWTTIVCFVHVIYGTPLDDYVNKPDPAFSWKLLQTYPSPTYTVYVLNMTSQQWLNGIIIIIFINIIIILSFLASYSSQPIWWHYMVITVPKVLKRPNVAFLSIGGGSNKNP
jgi:hypothetical protein